MSGMSSGPSHKTHEAPAPPPVVIVLFYVACCLCVALRCPSCLPACHACVPNSKCAKTNKWICVNWLALLPSPAGAAPHPYMACACPHLAFQRFHGSDGHQLPDFTHTPFFVAFISHSTKHSRTQTCGTSGDRDFCLACRTTTRERALH